LDEIDVHAIRRLSPLEMMPAVPAFRPEN